MLVLYYFSLSFFLKLSASTTLSLHEKRTEPLDDVWDRRRIEPDALLPMRMGLRQNQDALSKAEEWLMAVSDPRSPSYGRHWSQKEIIEAFQPRTDSLQLVSEWLVQHGIIFTHSKNRQWLAFDLPASKAEELLATQFFEHRTARDRFEVSCDEYSLPTTLTAHVDFVMPGLVSKDVTGRTARSREVLRAVDKRSTRIATFESSHAIQPATEASSDLSSRGGDSTGSALSEKFELPPYTIAPPFPPYDLSRCGNSVTPACIRALYNFSIPDPTASVSSTNSMGIFQEHSLTHQDDLNYFFDYYTRIPNSTSPIYKSIDGAVTLPSQTAGWKQKYAEYGFSESTLDLQMAMPIIYPQTVTIFQVDDPYWSFIDAYGFPHTSLFNTFLDAIDGSYCTYSAFNETGSNPRLDPHYPDSRPHGYKGKLQCGVFQPTNVISISYDLQERRLPFAYQRRQCAEFLKLALQGVSVFVASGDRGVGYCFRHPEEDRLFSPSHPTSCPWVTSVGQTRIRDREKYYDPEKANTYSGGGFSLVHPRPSYQDDAVTTYFRTGNSSAPFFRNGEFRNNTGRYNRDGRGFPDISAVGDYIATIVELNYISSGGTSASAPIVASLFNRIIEERIKAGKHGPLGLVNPVLYQNRQALNDIVIGHNPGSCTQGFKCAPGWDPASGLGTPNYPKLLDLFLSLP